MPYFVFSLTPEREATFINVHEEYKDAKAEVTTLRKEAYAKGETKDTFRLVFAKNKREGEVLLTTKREIASPLEEWEEKL